MEVDRSVPADLKIKSGGYKNERYNNQRSISTVYLQTKVKLAGHRQGLPGHVVASGKRAKEISF
jgi:hypothetical protein